MDEEGNATWCMIVYIHIRRNYNNGRTDRKGEQTYEQSHAYNKFKGCYKYGTEHKTRSTRNTGRTTGREENIHTRHRLIETGKQTRKVREGDSGYYW